MNEQTGQKVPRQRLGFRALLALMVGVVFSDSSCLPVFGATLLAGFTETRYAAGVLSCTAMEFAPDGRLFVCQKEGQLMVVKNGVTLATPFVTLPVDNVGERGLLGIAFDPGFVTNQFVYVYYTATTPATHNRVSRFKANGDVALAGSETIILELDNLSSAINHNGGAIHFGLDGKLYVAVGENTESSNAQSLTNRLGKLLRINGDGSIPTDNPFYNVASGANRSIWALGLRNPFTFAVQPGTGKIYMNDVGATSWEEINEGVAGANYGWPVCEGACGSSYKDPVFQYGHGGALLSSGCSIIGAAFYNPPTNQFPSQYTGSYFFADYCNGWIRRLLPGTNTVADFAYGTPGVIIDLKVGPDGRLYYIMYQNGIWAISATNNAPLITSQPVNQTVAVGESASFMVNASGAPTLKYQWQKNGAAIAGAVTNFYTIPAVTLPDIGALFRCLVTNAFGSVTSNPAMVVLSTNFPPTPSIDQPTVTTYNAGDTFTFSGSATDAEDGVLPASAFSWTILFHHADHAHPFLGPINGVTSGSFTIPNRAAETSVDVYYHILLTVTDSGGRQQTATYDIYPRTRVFTLNTVPSGLPLTLDGQAISTPAFIVGVVGMSRSIGGLSPLNVAGTNYEFVSWSDGGPLRHRFFIPPYDTNLVATFHYPIQLVATGATWKYLTNGSDQGTVWRGPNFNDSLWPSGPAQLGFGDGDEATVISGGPATNRFITTYFRRAWNVPNPALYSRLTLRLLRDDGAVVYLNGNEVFRNNMPAGPVLYNTRALTDIVGTNENIFLYQELNPASLLTGTNVLAVEIHQFATNSPDLSFSLELVGNLTLSAPAISITSPANGQTFTTTNVVFQAAASDSDGSIALVEFLDNDKKVGETSVSPYSLVLPYLFPGPHVLRAIATDTSGLLTEAAPVIYNVVLPPVTLVQTGAVWKFLANGSNQGSAWRGTNFNDSAWSTGIAQLGYGDSDEATTVAGGPLNNRYITTYFRRSWNVPDALLFTNLLMRLLRDDGAVVYLNSNEVFRSNMPDTPIFYNTPAMAEVEPPEETMYYTTNLSPALLVNGTNTLAVEIHQFTAISPDISFDLELLGEERLYSIDTSLSGSGLILSWPVAAKGYVLQSTPKFPATNWTTVTSALLVTNGINTLTLGPSNAQRFFRLVKP